MPLFFFKGAKKKRAMSRESLTSATKSLIRFNASVFFLNNNNNNNNSGASRESLILCDQIPDPLQSNCDFFFPEYFGGKKHSPSVAAANQRILCK
jgi:hypothetical protein